MSKAVAVPYIVALILAVVVIAIVGYLIFINWANITGVALEQQCRGDEAYYCGLWSKNGYGTKPTCKVDSKNEPCDFTQMYLKCAVFSWASNVNEQECRSIFRAA